MKTLPCHCCSGSGKEVDQQALAVEMRKLRLRSKLSLRKVGLRVGLSATYLFDLEHGHANWKPALVEQYRNICK